MYKYIKDFYNTNINNSNTNKNFVSKHFPEFYCEIQDDFETKFWCFIRDINYEDFPICENPNCGNKVKWEKGHKTTSRFCCNECFKEYKLINSKKTKKQNAINNGINEEDFLEFKEYIQTNGNIDKFKLTKAKTLFPNVYKSFEGNDWKERIYMFVHNINEIPTCKNPECNNKVSLKNMSVGFRTCCCNACIGKMQSYDEEFKEKVKHTVKLKSNEHLFNKYNIETLSRDKNYILIKDYCKHGDLKFYANKLTIESLKNNKCLCLKCNEEFYNNYNPSYEEMIEKQKWFADNYEIFKLSLSEDNMIKYMPDYLKIINLWSARYVDLSRRERIYLYKNNLLEKPVCNHKDCNEYAEWNLYGTSYRTHCKKHLHYCKTSKPEQDVFEYINSLSNKIKQKHYINRIEYDMIFNDKLLIEFNGLYWHSESTSKDKNYHKNKLKLANDNNKDQYVIWEDDWYYKNDLVKSMLLNKIGLTPNKIYARKCIIKEIDFNTTSLFLEENHIQGKCVSKYNIGLYYNDELVSIMTFGKTRMITNSLDNTTYELLRFCNKKYTNVIGGASK
ncbi:MAG: hypothetical protein RSF67_08235, partial [Clostridia bacterium]